MFLKQPLVLGSQLYQECILIILVSTTLLLLSDNEEGTLHTLRGTVTFYWMAPNSIIFVLMCPPLSRMFLKLTSVI